jgi:16S rRNA (guanine966-N2)-methyltransferase
MRPTKKNQDPAHARRPPRESSREPVGLRIIGGRFRGRKLQYSGQMRTRPMKDRLREAVFNLIGPAVRGKRALDLFAGTGALGLEAISRGGGAATFIEQHYPTAELLQRNIRELAVEEICRVESANTFIWARRQADLGELPCVIFCSPPYDFYVDRGGEMHALIERLMELSKPESLFVVEADKRFDLALLPQPNLWDVREYDPAVLGIFRKQ